MISQGTIGQAVDADVDIVIRTNREQTAGAIFSPCELYRYVLWRIFQPPLFRDDPNYRERSIGFLMLNPSKATHTESDPTVTRCIGHAKRWGFEAVYVLNLFAFRATDPNDMKRHDEPIGKLNDKIIAELATRMPLVLAYGNHATYRNRYRFVERLDPSRLAYFEMNKPTRRGKEYHPPMPKHPLYVASDADLKRYLDYRVLTADEIRTL